MPLTSASDISVVLSGGTVNINPNASLGGEPSSSPIASAVLNNLFADVTPTQSEDGREDYRCVYVFNDGDTPIYNLEIWIAEDFNNGGGSVEIGVQSQNETQRITVSGTPTGGSFTLSYKAQTFAVNWNADLAVWATNLQDGILDLLDDDNNHFFSEVSVIASNAGSSSFVFDIRFSGADGKRSFDRFEVASNDMLPNGVVSLLVSTPQVGSPINTVAPEINVDTTPPGGVTFLTPTESVPITLPVLEPTEGFPLWVKRTIPAGATAQENDGFKMSIRAESLAPATS